MKEYEPIQQTNLGEFSYHDDKPCIMVRHGEDEKTLTPELNQPLDREHIVDVHNFAESAVSYFKQNSGSFDGVTIICSPKIRAQETGIICRDHFSGENIDVTVQTEPLLSEMHQGEFIVDGSLLDNGEYPPLLTSWKAFQKQMKEGNLDYQFGDPSRALTPEDERLLDDYFISYGETQREITSRVYSFLEGLKQTDPHKLHLIVTHQVLVSKIQRTTSALSSVHRNGTVYEAGDFARRIEQTGNRISVEHAQGVAMSLGTLRWTGDMIRNELIYLNNPTDE